VVRPDEVEDRKKDDFLVMLSHELRNPLGPLVVAVDILQRDPPEKERKQAIEIIARQAEQLSRLITDLVDTARFARGLIQLREESVDVVELVQIAVGAIEAEIASRWQVVTRTGPSTLPVKGDAIRLIQVFGSILSNASKYSDQGGQIWIDIGRSDGDAIIKIRDEGAGIPADVVPLIFDLFAQSGQALDRTAGGLGLGLNLARRIVSLHGGHIEGESPGPGLGSTFTIRLPVREHRDLVDGQASKGDRGAVGPPSPLRVLIVDDHEDACDAMSAWLRALGCDVVMATRASEAIAAVEDFVPHVAILDIGLPEMDGFALARVLREDERLAQTRLIALTGYGSEADRRRSLAAGFAEHIVKPVEPERLKAILGLG
jgi:CheY-like chemotaxis protein/two-component sensor histidine kinase